MANLTLDKSREINLQKFGDGEKVILFLHGGGVRHHCYLPLINKLSRSHTVYTFDLPGHGKSPATDSIEEAIELISQTLIKIGKRKIIIIGHSFGGFCAYKLAEKHSNISHLVLLNPLIYKLEQSRLEAAFNMIVSKNIRGLIMHPSLIVFFPIALFDFFTTVFFQYTNTIKTINLIFRSAYSGNLDPKKINAKINIIYGEDDSLIPANYVRNNFYDITTFVKGEHDWCMADVKETTKIIENILL